jgi:hypothetical protein
MLCAARNDCTWQRWHSLVVYMIRQGLLKIASSRGRLVQINLVGRRQSVYRVRVALHEPDCFMASGGINLKRQVNPVNYNTKSQDLHPFG